MLNRPAFPGARLLVAVLTCGIAAACAGKPAASNPDPAQIAGETFRGAPASNGDIESAWWAGFDDPLLTSLVAAALSENPELDAADFSIAEATALLRLAGLDRQPSLTSGLNTVAIRPAGAASPRIEGRVDAGLAAEWELDAAGRLGALYAAAGADLVAARELRRDVAVSLAAETAIAYIDLRGAETRLAVARRNGEAQNEALRLVRLLFENGRATELDLDRAEAQYRTTLASLPVFQATIAAARNRLATLTGRPATDPTALVPDAAGSIPRLGGELVAGDPAALLRRRPDVRLAEQNLARAAALTDAARADIFPRITFNADLTALFREPGANFTQRSLGLGIGPAISWAGPDLRRVYARVDVSDARAGAAAAAYESAVLAALEEAETALSDYAFERARAGDLTASVAAARRAAGLATLRYEEGLDSFLAVIDAQRVQLDAEDRLATHEAETARRAVRVYRALGGIWPDDQLTTFRAG